MSVAVGVEIIFAAVAVGIYLAFIQALRFARPRWLANLVIGVGLPGVMLMLDYSAHRYTGMHRMQASMIFLGLQVAPAGYGNKLLVLNVEASRLSTEDCEDRLHAVTGAGSNEVNSET